jgi:glutathione S-transferase
MESSVTLYAFPPSHCSQKVRLALAEKHVDYTNRFVDIEMRLQNFEPGYLRLNPRGVVPTLVHGDHVVTDSARIIRYVDDTFDGPTLSPQLEAERKRMDEWIDLQDGLRIRELTFGSMKGAMGLLLRRVSLPLRKRKLLRLRSANPDLAEIYDAKIEDLRQWRTSITSPEEMAQARDGMKAALGRVEMRLGESPYLAGERYSLADLAWTCTFARLKMLGLADSFWGPERSPRIHDYYSRLRSRPSFDEAGVWERSPAPDLRRALLKAMLSGSSEVRVRSARATSESRRVT